MSNRDTIQNELRSLDSTLPVSDSPSFSVPEGYFENLASTLLAKIKNSKAPDVQAELSELSPLLAALPKTMPYSVPSFYFDNSLQSLPVPGAEAEPLFLAADGRATPYTVPAGYFESLPQQILAMVSEPQAKVIPLFRRTWMRAAAAAVITGGFMVGGLQIINSKKDGPDTAVYPADTTTKLTADAKPLQQEIKKVSTKELEDFVGKPSTVATANTPKKIVAKKEATDLLKDVSVNDMEDFLTNVPQTDEELFASEEQ